MREPCASCARRDQDFGGCRCQAFLIAGDARAADPVCHLSPQHGLIEQLAGIMDETPYVYRRPEPQRSGAPADDPAPAPA